MLFMLLRAYSTIIIIIIIIVCGWVLTTTVDCRPTLFDISHSSPWTNHTKRCHLASRRKLPSVVKSEDGDVLLLGANKTAKS